LFTLHTRIQNAQLHNTHSHIKEKKRREIQQVASINYYPIKSIMICEQQKKTGKQGHIRTCQDEVLRIAGTDKLGPIATLKLYLLKYRNEDLFISVKSNK
ncbi:hypothetical protein ACJX0J_035020, partial [Zea mays]